VRYLFLSNTDVKKYKLNNITKIITKFSLMANIAGYELIHSCPVMNKVKAKDGYPEDGCTMYVTKQIELPAA
jgi:hypothetical protein